jgi:hypothetical protein
LKKTVLYIGIALLATLFQFAKDIYPTTKLILKNRLCTYDFQDIKENMQKADLLAYTDEEELESFFVQIKNSYCQKNQ